MSFNNVIKVQKESDLPLDSVQNIVWDVYDRNCRTFFTAGWDGVVRLYEIQGSATRRLQKKWEYYFHHPVISIDITQNRLLIAGLATGQIGLIDIQNINNVLLLGSHEAPICKVFWVERYETLVTFGFDNLMKVFSLKPNQNNQFQIGQYNLPAKTNTVAYNYPYFLIGAQNGQMAVLNIDRISQLKIQNEYQYIYDDFLGIIKYTCSAISASKGRILMGTCDGRLISTTFTQINREIRISKPTVQRYQKKSVFRKQIVGQFNCLDFGIRQSKYQFVLFCGTEETGVFSPDKGTKVKSLSSNTQPVTAIAISPDCEYYAYAQGNDWNKGLEQLSALHPIKIFVCRIQTNQITMTGMYMR